MPKKNDCLFNDNWLIDVKYSKWLTKSNDKSKAHCTFCTKDFDISNMGVAALNSHLSGKKHSEIAGLRSSQAGAMFFRKECTLASVSAENNSKSRTPSIASMMIPASTLNAEILWTLKVVMSHFSLRSCLGLNELFSTMFPDSNIAKSFQLSKTKCGYLINYGLAPYYKNELVQAIKASPFVVLSFDESMNNVLQEEQMDLHIRYWEETSKKVCTRYFNSHFLKRPNAKNILDAIIISIKDIFPERLIQLSMDGPSTNWKVLDLLNENRIEKDYPCIANIGSCGLHVVHGAFKFGMETTNWDIGKILKAIWQLFHDSPARREIYIRICECDEFPLKYVSLGQVFPN